MVRLQSGLAADNIIEGSRKRARIGTSPAAVASPTTSTPQAGGESSQSNEEVTQLGFQLLDVLMHRIDTSDETLLCLPFLELPDRESYPDYYEVIRKPLCLYDIEVRLEKRSYNSFAKVMQDCESVCKNAKRYNQKDSIIWTKARVLHALVKDAYVDLVKLGRTSPSLGGPPDPSQSRTRLDRQPGALATMRAGWIYEGEEEEQGEDEDAEGEPDEDEVMTGGGAAATPGASSSTSGAAPAKPVKNSMKSRGHANKNRIGKKLLKASMRHLLAQVKNRVGVNGTQLAELFLTLPSRTDYPDYYTVIKNPIAFDMIEPKLSENRYVNAHAMMLDIRQVLDNAQLYNEDGSEIWEDAAELRAYIEEEAIPALMSDGFTLDPLDHRHSVAPPTDVSDATRQAWAEQAKALMARRLPNGQLAPAVARLRVKLSVPKKVASPAPGSSSPAVRGNRALPQGVDQTASPGYSTPGQYGHARPMPPPQHHMGRPMPPQPAPGIIPPWQQQPQPGLQLSPQRPGGVGSSPGSSYAIPPQPPQGWSPSMGQQQQPGYFDPRSPPPLPQQPPQHLAPIHSPHGHYLPQQPQQQLSPYAPRAGGAPYPQQVPIQPQQQQPLQQGYYAPPQAQAYSPGYGRPPAQQALPQLPQLPQLQAQQHMTPIAAGRNAMPARPIAPGPRVPGTVAQIMAVLPAVIPGFNGPARSAPPPKAAAAYAPMPTNPFAGAQVPYATPARTPAAASRTLGSQRLGAPPPDAFRPPAVQGIKREPMLPYIYVNVVNAKPGGNGSRSTQAEEAQRGEMGMSIWLSNKDERIHTLNLPSDTETVRISFKLCETRRRYGREGDKDQPEPDEEDDDEEKQREEEESVKFETKLLLDGVLLEPSAADPPSPPPAPELAPLSPIKREQRLSYRVDVPRGTSTFDILIAPPPPCYALAKLAGRISDKGDEVPHATGEVPEGTSVEIREMAGRVLDLEERYRVFLTRV